MNRFDRITAILIQLQSKRLVKAQDLAKRFEVSLRTIYRDIRTLEEAGVPIFGEAGSGYSIMDGFRLPPVMFTKEEATAFVAAEIIMENIRDKVIRKNFESSMFKIKSVLKNSEKNLVEELEEQIEVRQNKFKPTEVDNALDILFKAITEKKAVEITYRAFAKEKDTQRLIEPIGVYHENEQWYTIGFCHLRNDYRHFRIDRMQAIHLTKTERAADRLSMKEYEKRQVAKKQSLEHMEKIVIKVDKPVALYLQERKHHFGFVSEVDYDDYVEMTFLSFYPENGFARWYLMFADHAEIVEPISLKKRLKHLIGVISKKI
ncbi:MAG: transcriptional regulator [Flavobacteriales bacterium]|nr:transcriptional regulator [Flavobacteriales bacterium]|tara:strand:+ start:9378 stop:10331 length:954 start_codon:yes stop_codon:yes gene_type:complete